VAAGGRSAHCCLSERHRHPLIQDGQLNGRLAKEQTMRRMGIPTILIIILVVLALLYFTGNLGGV
jgi:hypothetical protein